MLNLNIVDILIIAVLGLSLISGMYKGFISSGLAAVGFVGAWFGALQLYPQLSNIIANNNALMDWLTDLLDAGAMFNPRSLGNTLVSTLAGEANELRDALNGMSGVPDIIKNVFANNVNHQLFQQQGLNTFTEYLGRTILTAGANVFSFVVIFAVGYLIMLMIVNLLNSVFHFPLLKHLDWLLGGIFGVVRGYAIMMLVLAVVPMLLSMLDINIVGDLINGSMLAQYFPINNGFPIQDIVNSAFSTVSSVVGG
ncbi:CvpA family protein [Eubacteriales bacterium OttesenSCG-928-N13]|nr:CvpA family protein [Eubacteriales bacterium OttesenSCG-928-N13]